MAHNSDYSKIWDPHGTSEGLSIDEIGKALGVSSRDIGALCTSGQIKKWNLYKPQALTENPNFRGITTLQMRQADNFGFDLSDFFTDTPTNFFALANFDWPYKARVAPYRMHDFSADNGDGEENGYKRNAECPFSADPGTTLTGEGTIEINARYATDADIDLSKLNVITSEEGNWHIAFIYKRAGQSGISVAHGIDIEDFITEGQDATVTINLANGNNDGIWVFTTLPEDESEYDQYKYLALPNGFRRYTVSVDPVSGIRIVPYEPMFVPHTSAGDLDSVDFNFEFEFVNNSSESATYTLTLEFGYGRTYDEIDATQIHPKVVGGSLPADQEEPLRQSVVLDEGLDGLRYDRLWVRAHFTSYVQGEGSKTKQIDFVNKSDVISSTPLSWVRLNDYTNN